MLLKQISIFMENSTGRLAEATLVLAQAGINIRALSVADTKDFGILRLVVDCPDKAIKTLQDQDFTAKTTQVLAVEVPDKPGGLYDVLKTLDQDGVNVEYMYSFVPKIKEEAIMIFRFDDMEKGIKTLGSKGFKLIAEEAIFNA